MDYESLRCNASTLINFNLTNHGFIRADNVQFFFPEDHPELTFTVSPYPNFLNAHESIIVPVLITSSVSSDCVTRRSENPLIVPRSTSVRIVSNLH